ncbi:unnamed protein product [Urochloa decumbens]|uniref:BLE2 protein n=1 Tax=Urochloa decumbens TaxID=240449 RepID=A0ABC9BMQ6_9POAL
MASATPAGGAGAGEVAIQISDAAADAGDESQKRERRLNRFVRVVAFGEWAGNAFGALAFVWATAVLLGGFCSVLKPLDFWYATVIIFIEAFRIFSRNYKLENQALFGTTRALRWINVPFVRMLGRPQEGNEVVLIMGLWIDLVNWLPFFGPMFMGILKAALLILMSKKMELRGTCQLTSRSRRCRRLQLWAVLIAFLIIYTLFLSGAMEELGYPIPSAFGDACASTEILTQVVAALLLIFRPQVVVNLTNTPWCRRLLSLSKVISAVSLAFGFAVALWPRRVVDPSSFVTAFTVAVLSLGSLQTPAAANNTLFGGRWIEAIVDILFLWHLLVSLPAALSGGHGGFAHQLTTIAAGISSILVLLMKNLQIPAAALQVLLSSSRFSRLRSEYRQPSPQDCTTANPNLVPAIIGFYVLALCEGSLYILASILGLFSFFPRRSLVRHSKLFHGQRGAKAIDLYYQHAYATCMDTGPFAAKKNLSLAGFATESLMTSSSSSEMQRAAVLVLGNLDSIQELRSRILGPNNRALSTLIGMLGWEDVQHRDIRLIAAGVIANMADSLTISEIPGMLKLVSSLLDADNQPVKNDPAGRQDSLPNVGNAEQLEHGQDDSGGCWVWRRWQQMKKKWSMLEEQPLTRQDSLPIQGMVILERLAHDPDNCAEIAKATYLIAKIVGLISYTTADSKSSKDNKQQHMMIFSSLNFVRRLAITGDTIGVALRQELYKNSFLINNLECVLEQEDSNRSPEVTKLVIEILRPSIWKQGKTLGAPRMAAGEALANLTIESPANCLAIMEEPGYELIKDLKNMLCEDEYRYVVASLLQNVCAHSTDKLRHHQGARNHLSSAIPMLMENIMSAVGKQLEPLIGLVSEISNVILEPLFDQLQLQANGSDLVQKLVVTLNSNRKPNPEYPRMRRVVVEMVISTVKLCPRYATIFREGGMMEALNKVERTPSKVEGYRVFYGDVGVVLESGSPLTALAATAKGLVHSAAPTLGA